MPRVKSMVARAAERATVLSAETQDTASTNTHLLYCSYCSKPLLSESSRSRHIAVTPLCRAAEEVALQRLMPSAEDTELEGMSGPERILWRARQGARAVPTTKAPTTASHPPSDPLHHVLPIPSPVSSPPAALACDSPLPPTAPEQPRHSQGREKAASIGPFVDAYPNPLAGAPISQDRTYEIDMTAYMKSCGRLADRDNFEVAEVLMTTGLTDAAKDRHLKSKLYQGNTPWPNVGKMLDDVDLLPHGPGWEIHDIIVNDGQRPRVQYLFARNVVDVVRELIGNPMLKNDIRYAPERHWTSSQRRMRIYSEMWTGEWWWRMQQALGDDNATIASLIVASDKTSLSVMCGGQQAYPVYLSLGNISKQLRRKPSMRTTVLLGYLPIDDFEDIADDDRRRQLKGQLIHDAMRKLLEPLKEASRNGVEMWCADGRLRRVYPIVAAYLADHPEQSLMACTSQASCPICTTVQKGRGSGGRTAPLRARGRTLEALMASFDFDDPGELRELSLKPWWPWWADTPYVTFGSCVAPDLLHQLYQGTSAKLTRG